MKHGPRAVLGSQQQRRLAGRPKAHFSGVFQSELLRAEDGSRSGGVKLPQTKMPRRDFLRLTLAASTAVGIAANPGETNGADSEPLPLRGLRLIDVNVSLSRWPFRRLPLDETENLVSRLKSRGVNQAWAGSFDVLLSKNLASVNDRLATECRVRGQGVLVPFGSVNPTLPDWQEDLRRCSEVHRMPGIRVHPNFHGYKLEDPRFTELLQKAALRGLVVQIAASMEDERVQHPLLRVANVELSPLPGLLEKIPRLRVVLLNWFRAVGTRSTASPSTNLLVKLGCTGQVSFDIAMVEGVGGVGQLLEQVPTNRVLFGSHAPFYYFESAALKLQESILSKEQLASISAQNARNLLRKNP